MKFLFLEDNPDDVELAVRELVYVGFEFSYTSVRNKQDFIKELPFADVLFIDCSLPDFSCEEALIFWHDSGEKQPFIILSGTITTVKGTILQNIGASAFVLKENLFKLGRVTKLCLDQIKRRTI